jgi:hypothetical protein
MSSAADTTRCQHTHTHPQQPSPLPSTHPPPSRAPRTFSPSEIAYWDFGKDKSGAPGEPLARKGSMGGLFSKIGSLFGSSASK